MKTQFIKNVDNYSLFWILDRYVALAKIIIIGKFGFLYCYLLNNISFLCFKKNFYIFNLNVKHKWLIMNSLIFHNFLQCLLGSFYLYSLELNFVGIGFKISFCNYSLNININVSHSIRLQLPHSIKIYILNKGTSLIFKSINKQLVGTIAACIKQLTATNKYTGKGIRYAYEILKLKERTKK